MLNGEERSLNMGGAPLRDHAGRITGAVVTARDVTWRRKMEQRLQANEWRYRRLTEAGIIGVIVIDLEGRLHEANDLFIQMVGYSKEELLSGSIDWSQLTPHEHQKQEEWILPLLRTKGEVPPFQMEYQRKDGSRFPALVTGAMIDQERGLAMELILDISQQQAAERRKQDFLGLVSHELRTPLTVIQGSLELLEMLLQRLPRGSSIEESNALMSKMETLLRQAQQHMSIEDHLVEALLDVSRLEANSFELTLQRHDLAQIVEQTVAVQRQLSPERRLTLCLPGELSVTVLVDAGRIGQALINYLNNALRYSWADGEIEIRLEVRGSDARVAVCDSGPGLAEEQQRRVWERFYRGEHHTGQPGDKAGLGLGLSIVQTIIQQHQGQVGVESQPGKGSTFWFTLPLAPKTA